MPRKKERFTVRGQDPLPQAFAHVKGVLEKAFGKPLEEILKQEPGKILHEIIELSTNPRKYRQALGRPLVDFLKITPKVIGKTVLHRDLLRPLH